MKIRNTALFFTALWVATPFLLPPLSNAQLALLQESGTKKGSDPAESRSQANFPEIGETLKSLTARYGEGLKNAGKIRIPEKDQYYWEIRRIGVNVVFEEGKAVMIVAHRVNGMITKDDIRQLLKANSDIYGWGEDENNPRWLRRDKKVEAFRELHHEDMFFIEDIAAVKESGVGAKPGSR